jgi:nucleotide-binding universal stress UspA family protein
MIALKHVLVATDFGEASDTAVAYGRELARHLGGRLTLLHVVDDVASKLVASAIASDYLGDFRRVQEDLEQEATRQLDGLLSDEDRRVLGAHAVCRTSGATATEILTFAKEAAVDLLVLGTHGRGAMAHFFLGSVAERVVRLAPCPVLTVRHPEHEFVLPDALQVRTHA